MKQLQQICIDCKINSPLLGDQLYDPNAFDLSKKKRPFGDKIKQLCQENNVFWDYKKNSRLALDLTTTDKASVDLKKRKEFLKVRGQWMLKEKGIHAFTQNGLKKLYDWGVINQRTYKFQLEKAQETGEV